MASDLCGFQCGFHIWLPKMKRQGRIAFFEITDLIYKGLCKSKQT